MTDVVTTETTSTVIVATPSSATVNVTGENSTVVKVGEPVFGPYGSFYDVTTQTGGSTKAIEIGETVLSDRVTIENGSEITFTELGIYNIAFSAQLSKSGGQTDQIYIWLRHNGVDVPDSATVLSITNQNPKLVAAWNFFVHVNTTPQQFQLMWYTSDTNASILHTNAITGANPVPAIPSVILTVNQVG